MRITPAQRHDAYEAVLCHTRLLYAQLPVQCIDSSAAWPWKLQLLCGLHLHSFPSYQLLCKQHAFGLNEVLSALLAEGRTLIMPSVSCAHGTVQFFAGRLRSENLQTAQTSQLSNTSAGHAI